MGTELAEAVRALLLGGVGPASYPGAVWAVGDADGEREGGEIGLLDPAEPELPMRDDTLFDLASLTKVLAAWSGAGTLWQEEALELDRPLGDFWPDTAGHPVGTLTARHLLTHTAGLPLRARLRELYGEDPVAVRLGVLHEALHRPPGEAVEYTDRAALILGHLVEHLSGVPLARYATTRVWQPLGMAETRFGPLPEQLARRAAPTEADTFTGLHLRGTVHDFSARLLGGACGIAGVFAPRADLGRFLAHLLRPRPDVGFGAAWTAESLRVQTGALTPARGLFWYPAPGTDPADDVWVHYGFTGTGMWVSPTRSRWAVLLTNKVYNTRAAEPLTTIRNTFRALVFR